MRSDYVCRERLLELASLSRVLVVEAGGGYGKSVLGEQLRNRLAVPTVRLVMRAPDADPAVMVHSLERSLRLSHLSDLAVTVQRYGSSPLDALEAMLDHLASVDERWLVMVDDAHHATSDDGGAFLHRLACDLPEPHLVAVLCRSLPEPAAGIRRLAERVQLTASDLAFTEHEVEEVMCSGHGLRLGPASIARVRKATGGWPAAVTLWATRLADLPEPEEAIDRIASLSLGVGALVEELLAVVDPTLVTSACQLAHLPLLSDRAASAALGRPGALRELAAAGLPLVEASPGWLRFTDPISEHLTSRQPLDPAIAVRAAGHYEEVGEDVAATRVLISGGRHRAAADLVGRLPPGRAASMGAAVLHSLLAQLPEAVLRESPRALVQLASVADADRRWQWRAEALGRAEEAAREQCDPVLIRRVLAEQAFDHLRAGRPEQARTVAAAVLAEAGLDEDATRSRALVCAGRLAELEAGDDRVLEVATARLTEASECARRSGDRLWTANVLLRLADDALRERCRYGEALATTGEALSLLEDVPRRRAFALLCLADTLAETGRDDEAGIAISEARHLAELLSDPDTIAYAAWSDVHVAANRGDLERLLVAVEECERNKGDWYEGFSGIGYLTDVADALDRLGLRDQAHSYLSLAEANRGRDERQYRSTLALVTARSGDPFVGRQMVADVMAGPGMSPRRRWRLQLLQAHAAARAGDADAGRLAASAFDYCTFLGYPQLPAVSERSVAAGLVELAESNGSLGARRLAQHLSCLKMKVLGNFEVWRGGRQLELPPGQPKMAVMVLAAHGGAAHVEELIELLWPDAPRDAGLGRLRNLLSRIRSSAGGLVLRDGDFLRLPSEVEVDALLFEREVREAIALAVSDPRRAVSLARTATGRYRGPLLPDVPFETWAAAPRERLRSLYLRSLDLLADDARRRADYDEAVRVLEQAIELEPFDEDRYERAASLLVAQGRVGSARTMAARAADAMRSLGLEPSFSAGDLLGARSNEGFHAR